MIKVVSYPRAALIGNPSDGYYGKTIAFVFSNFSAQVELEESSELRIMPCDRERLSFSNLTDLADEIGRNGYYGGVRLVKATIKTFAAYCKQQGVYLHNRNFTISYTSAIPGHLGLAGSSAIVTAALKALMQFYEVDIARPVMANLALAAEKDELRIGAGLQDRVAQVYNSPVFMNFDKALMQTQGYGDYIPFSKAILPPLYIAYRTTLAEGSEITHNSLAARYARGEAEVVEAMQQWAELAEQVKNKLLAGDNNIGHLLNANFDLRNRLSLAGNGNRKLVELARSTGASAKFTGSGGAIIGTYEDEAMFEKLRSTLAAEGVVVFKPEIV